MHLLPGSFDAYRVPEELESSSLSRMERLPIRALLAVALLLGMILGAFLYLRKSHTPAPPSPDSASSLSQSPNNLSADAADHAARVQHTVTGTIRDLRSIESELGEMDSSRRADPSGLDKLNQKIRTIRRKLEASLTDIK